MEIFNEKNTMFVADFSFSIFLSKKETAKNTVTIDFKMPYGEKAADNEEISKIAKLKVEGSYGVIDAKPDAVTGASSPKGATKLWDGYRYTGSNAANGNKIEADLGFFVLYGVAPYETYKADGMTGNEYSQKILNGTNGPVIKGTKIEKSKDGVITIRYAHAGGPTVYPFAYEMISDTNGIFKFGYNITNNRRSVSRITNDTDFENIEMTADSAKTGSLYWQGELKGTFEDNVFSLNGTLTETK